MYKLFLGKCHACVRKVQCWKQSECFWSILFKIRVSIRRELHDTGSSYVGTKEKSIWKVLITKSDSDFESLEGADISPLLLQYFNFYS